MTGKDLIIYILANDLEDTPIYDNGKLIGFMTLGEMAEKMGVGISTVCVWIQQGRLDSVIIGGIVYIYDNSKVRAIQTRELLK